MSARLVKFFWLGSGLLPARGGTGLGGLAERPRHIEEVESAVAER